MRKGTADFIASSPASPPTEKSLRQTPFSPHRDRLHIQLPAAALPQANMPGSTEPSKDKRETIRPPDKSASSPPAETDHYPVCPNTAATEAGQQKKGSSVKCADAFRMALTEEPEWFIQQEHSKTVNCLSYHPPPIQQPFQFNMLKIQTRF